MVREADRNRLLLTGGWNLTSMRQFPRSFEADWGNRRETTTAPRAQKPPRPSPDGGNYQPPTGI
jgi:hypothetical protein